MNRRRHETPLRRVYADGSVVWVARWTDRHGHRTSAGTFDLKREAQAAIDAQYDREARNQQRSTRPDVVGTYAETWTVRHPRSERTNMDYQRRLRAMLDAQLDGRPLRNWRMADVGLAQVDDLIAYLLIDRGHARRGAQGMLFCLSAMWQNARRDGIVDFNPFHGARIKPNDPRITKRGRPVRVFSWEDMHRFAAVAATVKTGKAGPSPMDRWRPVYAEAMVRVLSDCGLRLGEMLALAYSDWTGDWLTVRRTAWRGSLLDGTKTDHGQDLPGRIVPVPPGLRALLEALPPRIDRTALLFQTTRGFLWREPDFYERIWTPAQEASGLDCRPHELRHGWVSNLRAAGIDPADLAKVGGHTVDTATKFYTHPLEQSAEAIRKAVG